MDSYIEAHWSNLDDDDDDAIAYYSDPDSVCLW